MTTRDPRPAAAQRSAAAHSDAGKRLRHAAPSRALSAQQQRRLLQQLCPRGADGEPAPTFDEMLRQQGLAELRPACIDVLQLNVGKLCNMSCSHCHVDAGPHRIDETMSRETMDACLGALDRTEAHTVDITGGAPEFNADFRYLVDQALARGKHVIDRCNLTVLLCREHEDLPQWFARRGVEVVGSLPHYRQRNTDALRGAGTFERSIEALRRLNAAGYGSGDPSRRLTLMTNPSGAFLAGNQASMEREWKAALQREHGIRFDRLFALNNMPIARFLQWLERSGNLARYMERLVGCFNPAAVAGLMCRTTLSVSWDGRLFDCDFNQMLEIEAAVAAPHVSEFDAGAVGSRRICTDWHCYGCTAGCGSSCGGAPA